MKKYINKSFLVCTLIFLSVSCENEAALTTLKEVSFSQTIVASPNTVILSSDNENKDVTAISWPTVEYPVKAPVSYALQFDVLGDTEGATAWSKSIRVEAGEDVLSKSFLGSDLNKMAIRLGLPVDISGKIMVRLEANLDRKIYSEAIALTVTPFAKQVVFGAIYMPGSYQGFDINTAAALGAVDIGIYKGYVTIPVGAGLGFKLNTARNWDQFYGAGSSNDILVDHSDNDFQMPGAGSYQMTVNLNTLKWSSLPYSWGVVGDATAGGWDNSTNMTYDHQLKIWKFTGALKVGNVKFRLNNTWTINYGPKNNTEGIMYLDNPGAHFISVAGNYEITFSIQEKDPTTGFYPATGTYTVKKI